MSVIKWTTERRCIFNRIFEDNVLCIASPSTGDLHEFVRRIAEISSLVRPTIRYEVLTNDANFSPSEKIFSCPTDSHNSRRVE